MPTEEALALGLAEAGLPLIAPAEGYESAQRVSMRELVEGLVECPNPLFRMSVIPLWLSSAESAKFGGRGALGAHLYTAAVCLQRLWRTRLALARRAYALKDFFSAELGLPDPSEACLAAISERFESGVEGVRIRGFDRMAAKLVHEMFGILSREDAGASAR